MEPVDVSGPHLVVSSASVALCQKLQVSPPPRQMEMQEILHFLAPWWLAGTDDWFGPMKCEQRKHAAWGFVSLSITMGNGPAQVQETS